MTEAPSPIFYATAKPEIPKPESKIVTAVKKVVEKWWERVGPNGVEDRFAKAHEHILQTFTDEDRKKAYELTAKKWQKAGKVAGISAMLLDSGFVGLGIAISQDGIKSPRKIGTNVIEFFYNHSDASTPSWERDTRSKFGAFIREMHEQTVPSYLQGDYYIGNNLTMKYVSDKNLQAQYAKAEGVGKILTIIPILSTVTTVLGKGPFHALSYLIAGGAEQLGILNAKRHNYVDSGKAAEHAAKLGNAVGKAANYALEHQDDIRKTVKTVQEVKIKADQHKQAQADAALDKEYNDWIAHHPDKAYYDQSGIPMPSKTEYKRQKDADEAAKKANLEAERRGSKKY